MKNKTWFHKPEFSQNMKPEKKYVDSNWMCNCGKGWCIKKFTLEICLPVQRRCERACMASQTEDAKLVHLNGVAACLQYVRCIH